METTRKSVPAGFLTKVWQKARVSTKAGGAGLVALTAMALPGASHAWSSNSTSITGIEVFEDGHVWVYFGGWGTGNNSCGSPGFSLGFVSAPQQKAMLALALTAMATGKSVAVQTISGQCDGGQEVVQWISLNAQ